VIDQKEMKRILPHGDSLIMISTCSNLAAAGICRFRDRHLFARYILRTSMAVYQVVPMRLPSLQRGAPANKSARNNGHHRWGAVFNRSSRGKFIYKTRRIPSTTYVATHAPGHHCDIGSIHALGGDPALTVNEAVMCT
jgi:hypothetical protein